MSAKYVAQSASCGISLDPACAWMVIFQSQRKFTLKRITSVFQPSYEAVIITAFIPFPQGLLKPVSVLIL